jgi:hypothetical protein
MVMVDVVDLAEYQIDRVVGVVSQYLATSRWYR